MKRNKLKNIIILIASIFVFAFIVIVLSNSKTSNKLRWHILFHCKFDTKETSFDNANNTYITDFVGYIDLEKALDVEYDTLYLISCGFERDISDIIGFQYNEGDFTEESEDKNLLILVKNNSIVYQDKIKSLLGIVNFFCHFDGVGSFCLLKHSSSIYRVKRERDGLIYRYYLFNNDNVANNAIKTKID